MTDVQDPDTSGSRPPAEAQPGRRHLHHCVQCGDFWEHEEAECTPAVTDYTAWSLGLPLGEQRPCPRHEEREVDF